MGYVWVDFAREVDIDQGLEKLRRLHDRYAVKVRQTGFRVFHLTDRRRSANELIALCRSQGIREQEADMYESQVEQVGIVRFEGPLKWLWPE